MDNTKSKAMTIDIRKGGIEQISRIVFADSPHTGTLAHAVSLADFDQYVRIYNSGGYAVYLLKSDIENMIKALQKAQELWPR